MHQAISLLHRRRSIRKYTAQPVSEEQLQMLLAAAMAAPSASNRQPWQFIVVQSRTLLDQLAEVHQYTKMLKQAPLCIAVCGDASAKFWQQDCAAATQNILLAATGLGLGAVWLGIYPNPEPVSKVVSLLNIPGSHLPLCLISIGHPDEHKDPANRYDAAKVHREQW
ncbi:MAG: nitroreductase family protein [Bacillota bacterium]